MVSSFCFNDVLAYWFIFQSSFRFGFMSGLRNVAAAEVVHCVYFLIPPFCDQPLSLPLPDEDPSAGLIVSKQQMDYLTQLKHTHTEVLLDLWTFWLLFLLSISGA